MTRAQVGCALAHLTLARAFTADEWKAWMTKNDVTAPPLRGAELNKYLETQYKHTRSVLVDLGLAK